MKKISLPKRAIALPLIGLVLTWALSMVAQWVILLTDLSYDTIVRPSNYIFLAAFALAGFASLIGHGWAHRAVEADESDSLARAALRFTTLSVVVSLAVNTIYALGSFIGAFNSSSQSANVGLRFVWIYTASKKVWDETEAVPKGIMHRLNCVNRFYTDCTNNKWNNIFNV